jgi:integration host factor subunit beta
MTKLEISLKIAEQLGVDQVLVKQIVQMTLDGIVDAIATEGRIELRDFGVFEVHVVKPRKARNPRTGAEVMVPEKRRVRFKAGKVMGERVANGVAPAGEKTAAPVAPGLDSHS